MGERHSRARRNSARGQVLPTRMRVDCMVVRPPDFDHDLRLDPASQARHCPTFITEFSVEAFVGAALPRLAGINQRRLSADSLMGAGCGQSGWCHHRRDSQGSILSIAGRIARLTYWIMAVGHCLADGFPKKRYSVLFWVECSCLAGDDDSLKPCGQPRRASSRACAVCSPIAGTPGETVFGHATARGACA